MLATIDRMEKKHPDKIIIADIPLLYETKQEHLYDGILVVYGNTSTQIKRLMQRNNLTEEEAKQRISLQMSLEEKKSKATWVIDNNGTLEQTKLQVDSFMAERQPK